MKVILTLGLMALVSHCALAVSAVLTPDQAYKESDALALIRILSTGPLLSDGKYTKVARAEVLEPIKGLHGGDTFNLDYDTGTDKLNVVYGDKEQAIVVLRRLPSGHYETMHADCGKFSVEQGSVLDCYLLGEPGKVPESTSLDEAIRQLRIQYAASKE